MSEEEKRVDSKEVEKKELPKLCQGLQFYYLKMCCLKKF